MAAKKTAPKKKTAKKAPQKSRQKSLYDTPRKQIALLIFFAFAVFMGAVVFIEAGGVWGHLRNFFFGAFGVTAFVIPFFTVFLTVVCAFGKDTKKFKYKTVECVIIYTLVIAFVHIVQVGDGLGYGEAIKSAYNAYKNFDEATRGIRFGTGVYGALFGGVPLLISAGNKLAAGFIDIFLLIILLMLFTGTTLVKLFRSFKTPADAVAEYAGDKAEEIKESIDTVSSDISERKQKNAERRENRKKTKASEEFPFDVPLSEEKARPDMGLDNIFKNDASILENGEKGVSMKAVPPKKHDVAPIDEPLNIDLLDSFEDAPVKNAPPLDELFNKKNVKTKAQSTLEKRVEELNTAAEKEKKEDVPEKIASSEVEKARAEIESEIAANAVPEKKYELPPLDCLDLPKKNASGDNTAELRERAEKIVSTLQSFGVGTHIVDICRSPSVTRFELQPDPGVKISRITALSDDIAMNLAASGVRIEAPIPNKNAVGIEVPNAEKTTVTLREIIDSPAFRNSKSKLNVALGRDIQGEPTCCDIAKMPHLLVAGTTGSGKSVCLNSMIVSILYNATPDEVKLVMIDPKKVEFTVYRSIPHLLVPVVSDPRKAAGALSWAVAEMDKRYASFAENGVRNLQGYNSYAEAEGLPKMPQIVIIIDELADLMMAASSEVEDLICRLAQKARAAGMHLIVATQRPSVDVITGLIKANIPSRIAFAVKSQVDSRTIIDTQGAEKLLGYGDMLFCPVGLSKPLRVQGAFLSDEEIERVIDFVKTQGDASYDESVIKEIEAKAAQEDTKKKGSSVSADVGSDDGDEMIPKAIEVVVEAGMASTTLLQRKLKLGYARAARIIDELSEKGIVGPYEGSKPRKVLITRDQWYEMQALSQTSPKEAEPKQPSLFDSEPSSEEKPEPREEHNYFGGAADHTFEDDVF